jgi:hypothetical protein
MFFQILNRFPPVPRLRPAWICKPGTGDLSFCLSQATSHYNQLGSYLGGWFAPGLRQLLKFGRCPPVAVVVTIVSPQYQDCYDCQNKVNHHFLNPRKAFSVELKAF